MNKSESSGKFIITMIIIFLLFLSITVGSYNFGIIYGYLSQLFSGVIPSILFFLLCVLITIALGCTEYSIAITNGFSNIDIFLISLINLFKYVLTSMSILYPIILTIQFLVNENLKLIILSFLVITGIAIFIANFTKVSNDNVDTIKIKSNLEYIVFFSIIFIVLIIVLLIYKPQSELDRGLFNIGMIINVLLTIILTNSFEKIIDKYILKKRRTAVQLLINKKRGSFLNSINILVALVTVFVFTDTVFVGAENGLKSTPKEEYKTIAEGIIGNDQFMLMVFIIGTFSYVIYSYIAPKIDD